MPNRRLCHRAVSVCPSVCPSRSCIPSERINIPYFQTFSPSGRETNHYSFLHQTMWQYSGGDPPPLMGASNAGRVWKIAIFDVLLHRVLSTLRPSGVIHTAALDRGKLVTLVAGNSKRRSLLMVGDGRRSVYDKKPQRYAEVVNLKPTNYKKTRQLWQAVVSTNMDKFW